MKLTLFALAECDELVAMTREEWAQGCDRGEIMCCLMHELGDIEVNSRTWVYAYIKKNHPHLLVWTMPFKSAARKE
jgi:predicted HD phosphohydrolase